MELECKLWLYQDLMHTTCHIIRRQGQATTTDRRAAIFNLDRNESGLIGLRFFDGGVVMSWSPVMLGS